MKRGRGERTAARHWRASLAPAEEDVRGPAPPPEEHEGGVERTLSVGYCRLCHGRFSSRSLRQAFGKVPVRGRTSQKQRRMDQVFFADFQQLVGVSVRQDPRLPQFVCRDCHARFYKCRSVLKTFIQRVNISPTSPHSSMISLDGIPAGPCTDLITSSPECLHSLVSWTHSHAGGCSSVPIMQGVLSTQYCGIIRAVWGCGVGHDYIMEAEDDQDVAIDPMVPSGNGIHASPGHSPAYGMEAIPPIPETGRAGDPASQNRSSAIPLETTGPLRAELDFRLEQDGGSSPDTSSDLAREDGGDLNDCDFQDVREERGDLSSDNFSEAHPKKRRTPKKKLRKKARKKKDPKERKKPGPKPGWQKKLKREREELPMIYKCPYQGCTAVYRGHHGMKKHIKEQHEEVRERPCPHPGCNKVFKIDRYLQRHIKLIHTEERNYICDQCGQTFKQQKHLSVHQMRHSGAKPLQCEVCGFQCRQRASLKYHMTKHKAEADLEFACDQCGKRFEKAHNLNIHMSMVHPLIQTPDKPPETGPGASSGTMAGQAVTPDLANQRQQQLPSGGLINKRH